MWVMRTVTNTEQCLASTNAPETQNSRFSLCLADDLIKADFYNNALVGFWSIYAVGEWFVYFILN